MDRDPEGRDMPRQVRLALARWEGEGGAGSAASVLAARALGFDVPGFDADARKVANRPPANDRAPLPGAVAHIADRPLLSPTRTQFPHDNLV